MGIPGGAGKLNQFCDIQVRAFTTTPRGGTSESWSDLYTAVRCAFKVSDTLKFTKMGARDIAAEDRKGVNKGTFIIRYRSGLDRDAHRLVLRGVAWNIDSIRDQPGGKRVYLEIDVTEQIEIAAEV